MPRIGSLLSFRDHLGACKARWGIDRMHYLVPPGLYAIGNPSADAEVVVTANYKMSYDVVRQQLEGRDLWLLVLETFGINVWCAAGKGSFGTGELVRRIQASGLARVVSHRRLLLPILGAPGVAAHEVARRTGFNIRYATTRAADLPEFLDNGLQTTPAMGQLTFNLGERLVLIPVELVSAAGPTAAIAGLLGLTFGLAAGFSAAALAVAAYLGAALAGLVLAPLLLPWLPGRSFAVKGWIIGLLWALAVCSFGDGNGSLALAMVVALPAVSAFHALNFTGCTPFTSRSGVKKEMRLALPIMACAVVAGLLLTIIGRFL